MQIPFKGAAEIACGGEMTLAIDGGGRLFEWGPGKPGLGAARSQITAAVPNVSAVKVAAGWQHCAAITARGRLLTWGWGGSQGAQRVCAGTCLWKQ